MYTTNFSDSAYIMNTTITAYLPDNRTSLSIQTIIYLNYYLPKAIQSPYNNLIYWLKSPTNNSE